MAGQTITKPRGDKTQRYVFYLGLLLAGIAAIIVFVAVSNSNSTGGGGDVGVVVAKEAIPADTRVTGDMLEVQFVSPEEAVDGAFGSRSQVIDRVVTEDVEGGKQIVPSMVSEVTVGGIVSTLEPGMRAIAVDVQEVVTAGGNLKGGDHVDVVAIFEVEDAEAANEILRVLGLDYTVVEPPRPAPEPAAEGEEAANNGRLVLTVTMLQNVKLLAMAQKLTETSASGNVAEELDEAETEPRAATATLELPPQSAQEITWADHFGILRMDARAVGDDAGVDVVPTLLRIENTR